MDYEERKEMIPENAISTRYMQLKNEKRCYIPLWVGITLLFLVLPIEIYVASVINIFETPKLFGALSLMGIFIPTLGMMIYHRIMSMETERVSTPLKRYDPPHRPIMRPIKRYFILTFAILATCNLVFIGATALMGNDYIIFPSPDTPKVVTNDVIVSPTTTTTTTTTTTSSSTTTGEKKTTTTTTTSSSSTTNWKPTTATKKPTTTTSSSSGRGTTGYDETSTTHIHTKPTNVHITTKGVPVVTEAGTTGGNPYVGTTHRPPVIIGDLTTQNNRVTN